MHVVLDFLGIISDKVLSWNIWIKRIFITNSPVLQEILKYRIVLTEINSTYNIILSKNFSS